MIRPSALSPARLFTGFAAAWLVLWGFFFVTAWVIPGSQSPFFAGTADLLRDFLNPMIYASELDPYRNPVNGLWEKSHPRMCAVRSSCSHCFRNSPGLMRIPPVPAASEAHGHYNIFCSGQHGISS